MKHLVMLAGLLALTACAAQPTVVSGDAWSYRLLPEELPAGWAIASQDVYTAADLNAVIGTVTPITGTTGLSKAAQLYSARYRPPESSQYADFTLDVIRYNSIAEAQEGMSLEALGAEWEQVLGVTLGDESRIWRFRNPPDTPDQGLYRVDARYRNAVVSVSMLGAATVLPNPDEVVSRTRQVLAKLQAAPQPPALEKLQTAQLPDLRPLLLTPAQIQAATGGQGEWSLNNLLLPGWVNNEDFSSAEARATLDRLGRLTGYQLWLIKPPADEGQSAAEPAVGLFQQVSAYRRADSAASGLQAMIGLSGVSEAKDAPAIGNGARLWNALIPQDRSNPQTALIATTEISFRAGQYVASVQLQAQPGSNPAASALLQQNRDLAIALAQALAEKLRTVQP
jgi:hypothetical protein